VYFELSKFIFIRFDYLPVFLLFPDVIKTIKYQSISSDPCSYQRSLRNDREIFLFPKSGIKEAKFSIVHNLIIALNESVPQEYYCMFRNVREITRDNRRTLLK
jgi:hypothetical protein